MEKHPIIYQSVARLLVFGRPPLVFAGLIFAVAVILTRNPVFYLFGVICLFISMSFDLVVGWFSVWFRSYSKLAHLADRIMNRVVYSITFPLIAAGMMWRFHYAGSPDNQELIHIVFVLLLSITVLIRDNFANFMRSFAVYKEQSQEMREINRLRTMIAAPVGAILYAYAFYIPDGHASFIFRLITWTGNNIPLRVLFFIEILFLIMNFGSVAAYCRKYGTYCLDELCLGDELLRRRILSFFPNALTVMNAMMGGLAVFFAYQGRVREAYLILVGAAFFDKMDGTLARRLGLTEPLPESIGAKKHSISFGSILDDISDGVSFCIAPAIIFYVVMSGASSESIQQLPYPWLAVAYAVLGLARLVYFTLDRSPIPGFFKGLPTPAAALFVSAPFIMLSQSVLEQTDKIEFWGIFCFVTMLIISLLLNAYPIRYIHFGRLMGRQPWWTRFTVLLIIATFFTPYFGHVAFSYLFLYVISPLFTWRIAPEIANSEIKPQTK